MNIIQMSLSASCIIVIAIIIRAAALDKLPKRLFQLLWLVVVPEKLLFRMTKVKHGNPMRNGTPKTQYPILNGGQLRNTAIGLIRNARTSRIV